jgi:hypothetical protein
MSSEHQIVQEKLRSTFGVWSLCAMAVVLPGYVYGQSAVISKSNKIFHSAWSFAASAMVIGIYGGGPAVEIWGALAVGAALSIFCLNLAEYASAFPNPAGVTYAAARLGGPKYGRICVSYSINQSICIHCVLTIQVLLHRVISLDDNCLYPTDFDPGTRRTYIHLCLSLSPRIRPSKVADLAVVSAVQCRLPFRSKASEYCYWRIE